MSVRCKTSGSSVATLPVRLGRPFGRNVAISAATLLLFLGEVALGQNVNFNGGPIMPTPIITHLIFWHPACPAFSPASSCPFDTTQANGIGNYESVIHRFFTDVSATSYFNILTQYFGKCPRGSSNSCVPLNGSGAVIEPDPIGTWDDTTNAYPHTGTVADPLQDSDIQNEINRALVANPSWVPGPSTEFFVFTGTGMQECSSAGCTFAGGGTTFCAYHDDYSHNGKQVIYAYLPSDIGLGCTSIGSPNGQAATDLEILVMSHEFFESVSDPLPSDDVGWNGATGEIGEGGSKNCTGTTGATAANGSNVTWNGNPYVVQQIWSDDPLQSGCIVAFGPTVQLTAATGNDNVRGDTGLTATLATNTSQTATLKPPGQYSWNNQTTQVRVFAVSAPQLTSTTETLTSFNSSTETNDAWQQQSLDVRLLSPLGALLCDQNGSGTPLATVTDGQPFLFNTPNCSPNSSVPQVFDSIAINIQTGNDDARSDSQVTATLSGQSSVFCLKPSTSMPVNTICTQNSSNATDQNGNNTWNNWTSSNQIFPLTLPVTNTATLGTLTITLTQSDSSCGNAFHQGCDNWDIQGITVSVFNSRGPTPPQATLLSVLNPQNGDNCIARLKAPSNSTTVTFTLDGTVGHVYVGGKGAEPGETTNCQNNGG